MTSRSDRTDTKTDAAPPDGFKTTEIGQLPAEWCATKPEELVTETRNGDWGSPPDENVEDAVPARVVRGTDFPNAHAGLLVDTPVRLIQASSLVKRKLEPGDVLIELSGGSKHQATGRALLVRDHLLDRSDHPVLFTNFVKRLRVDVSKVDPEFFWRAWSYAYGRGRTKTYEKRTTGIRNFKYRDFVSNEVFPLPPLPEQRAIARVLRTVQEAIEATERVIDAAKELKRSMMEYLFTYGPVPVDQAEKVELKRAEAGVMPRDWPSCPLDNHLSRTQYGLSIRAEATGTYPMLRMNNLVDGRVDASDLKYVELSDDDFAKFRVDADDVLFNRTNSHDLVGKTSVFDLKGDYVFASYLIRLVPDGESLHPHYLNEFLNWESAARRLRGIATRGVSQSNISATKLKVFHISLPDRVIQDAVTEKLSVLRAWMDQQNGRRDALQMLFNSLLHHLMTGKLRVTPTEADLVSEAAGHDGHDRMAAGDPNEP